ncbi:MAG: TolC family protein [Methylococcales bacterium]|nr:TolC family protein [Methylococcales bacterium]
MLSVLVFCFPLSETLADNSATLPSYPETKGALTLSKALQIALIKNPELAVFSTAIQIEAAKTFQESRYPNPDLTFGISNFGNPAYEGFDGESISLELSQLIELGGKRAARIKAANLTKELAVWDYETKRIDVMTQVAQAFIKTLAAQEFLHLSQKIHAITQQMSTTVATLFRLGNVASIEKINAKTVEINARLEQMRAEKNLEIKRKQLAATWGSSRAKFNAVVGDLEAVQELPSRHFLLKKIKQNPDLARWHDEINQRQALIHVEKAKAVPDVTVTVGVNHNLIPNEATMSVGFSIPLPIFDRNQGAILAANYDVNKAEAIQKHHHFTLKQILNDRYQQLEMAYEEIIILRDELIPNANSRYEIAKKGYQYGKFDLLNVLDAQRTLFTIQKQYLNILTQYHLNVAFIERLTGSALHSVIEKTES